ncbi:MAG TPA: hypothetical protein VJ741_01790 [Solirubrobacteraceae bacterium]|nr:hypothetical protein [Solirubrobacteraceae bacterium]
MLWLSGGQVESLWDEVLPGEVRELPEDLAAVDVLLRDPALLEPIARSWQREAVAHGRPTISIATYVRLMVVKQRTGWAYETLVREVWTRSICAGSVCSRWESGCRTNRRCASSRAGWASAW